MESDYSIRKILEYYNKNKQTNNQATIQRNSDNSCLIVTFKTKKGPISFSQDLYGCDQEWTPYIAPVKKLMCKFKDCTF